MPPTTLSPHGPWPYKWQDPRMMNFDVYPTAHQGVLNYGLNRTHALAGMFPTAESMALRLAGQAARDEFRILDNPVQRAGAGGPGPAAATGGMQLGRCNPVRVEPGSLLIRFGDDGGGHKGGWWTERSGFFRMLMRVEPKNDGLPGVRGGSQLNLRDYARKYSEVLGEWGSQMKYIFATKLQAPIMAFRGMGAAQRSANIVEVMGANGLPVGITYEHMDDDNRQLFIPNVYARIDGAVPGEPRFFAPIVKWHPEVLEHHLVPAIHARLARGEGYRAIITDVEQWMMKGDRRAPLGEIHSSEPPSASANALD